MSVATMASASIGQLESTLIATKLTNEEGVLYPSHAFARGGIGVLVSTGTARGPTKRLPQAVHAAKQLGILYSGGAGTALLGVTTSSSSGRSRPVTVAGSEAAGRTMTAASTTTYLPGEPTTTTSVSSPLPLPLGSTIGFNSTLGSGMPSALPLLGTGSVLEGGDVTEMGAAASVVLGGTAGVPEAARHEWERGAVVHPADFVPAARRARAHDVRPASKWAGISFYENNPDEVKRHLDIVNTMDQIHEESKRQERETERLRHFSWAARQREIFRRQRQEVAARYARAGLPLREAQRSAMSAPSHRSSLVTAGSEGSGALGGTTYMGGPLPFGAGSRPVTVGTMGYTESVNAARPGSIISNWGSTMLAEPAPLPSISLPKPTFVKIYDRISAEADEGPRAKAEAYRQKLEAAARAREGTEVEGAVRELDDFEAHMNSLQRKKSMR
mmetsp:Transcript_5319/g.11626  ORF Transcript_5319/g.11626 Transcript_5319/m.11626 type:complete len:444 (-) Transcript_5319:174-1505(-)|eukprot:CAMPEP_0202892240 /NCGR_PEP_ID=MMETSP1392-20130828/2004_1 /ASSEMBLY_ACC=CAM_ASM_000868 /TAXON_ID=225041 /ORGANISM="Chlamydomonas chlamydogama, Strain SAG 11-48b" /LENGTH=443 /DNA_ID=CAMNT_0049576131 /DNA_START=447 /DNA_END=1778 /DNA_ORIENTATION=+